MKKSLNLFKGRISRKNFFFAYLLLLGLGLLYFGLSPVEGGSFGQYLNIWVYGLIILLIPFFILALSLHVRRWHDIGLSGFFVFAQILFIAFAFYEPLVVISSSLDILYWAILFLKTGEDKDNEYGAKPSSDIKFLKAVFNLEK